MGLHVGEDAAKAFSEQAKAMGWEEDDMADDEGIVCIICREGYKYKPEEVVQKYLLCWYQKHLLCWYNSANTDAEGAARCWASMCSTAAAPSRSRLRPPRAPAVFIFTCFTSTKVQILTPEEQAWQPSSSSSSSSRRRRRRSTSGSTRRPRAALAPIPVLLLRARSRHIAWPCSTRRRVRTPPAAQTAVSPQVTSPPTLPYAAAYAYV
jgi:hypothetical protein